MYHRWIWLAVRASQMWLSSSVVSLPTKLYKKMGNQIWSETSDNTEAEKHGLEESFWDTGLGNLDSLSWVLSRPLRWPAGLTNWLKSFADTLDFKGFHCWEMVEASVMEAKVSQIIDCASDFTGEEGLMKAACFNLGVVRGRRLIDALALRCATPRLPSIWAFQELVESYQFAISKSHLIHILHLGKPQKMWREVKGRE